MGRVLRSRPMVATVAFIVGIAIATGVAWAAIPDSTTGTITACYPTSGTNQGVLRVIDYQSGQRCGTGEASLTWSKGSPRSSIASDPSEVSLTTLTGPTDLGGPNLAVTVPPNGIITVYLSVSVAVDGDPHSINAFGDCGDVWVYAGSFSPRIPGILDCVGNSGGEPAQLFAQGTFQAPPGTLNFHVLYDRTDTNTNDGWTGAVHFENRKLIVVPVIEAKRQPSIRRPRRQHRASFGAAITADRRYGSNPICRSASMTSK